MASGGSTSAAVASRSSNANNTLWCCFASSVERKVFAAVTTRDVAVCAIRGASDKQIAATFLPNFLIDRKLIYGFPPQLHTSSRLYKRYH